MKKIQSALAIRPLADGMTARPKSRARLPYRDWASSGDLRTLAESYARSVRAENKSPRTVTAYLESLRLFSGFLAAHQMPLMVARIRREHVESYIGGILETQKASTAHHRYRALHGFFKWCVIEGEAGASPMAHTKPPAIPEEFPPVISEDSLRRLLQTCAGTTFADRRDHAIIRLLLDTGMRLSELTNLCLGDVDLTANVAVVVGKGRRPRSTPFGRRTALALDKYLRMRAKHAESGRSSLWLSHSGHTGVMTANGVSQAVARRAGEAGLGALNVHRFRHTFAHQWLAQGGQEGDLMHLAGWRSRSMLSRYAASAAADRARHAYVSLSPGDRL